jgi:hypothetical protein
MAKFFLIGEVGDEGIWLVDVESKSVERIEEADLAGSGVPGRVDGDSSMIRGINLAVATESRTGPSAHNRLQVHA